MSPLKIFTEVSVLNFFTYGQSSPNVQTIRRCLGANPSGSVTLPDGSSAIVANGSPAQLFLGSYGAASNGVPFNPSQLGATPGTNVSINSLSTNRGANASTDFSFSSVLSSVTSFATGSIVGLLVVAVLAWWLWKKFL